MDNSPLADIPLLPGYGYAALMENPSGLPQGLDNASRCPHTHSPTTTKDFFSFREMKKGKTGNKLLQATTAIETRSGSTTKE
jgi:hypothetical protein